VSLGPGKWQRAILAQLVKSESFLLVEFMRYSTPGWKQLDRKGRHSRRVAIYHAAKDLEKKERCRIVLKRSNDRRGRLQDHVFIYRPGSAPAVKIAAALVTRDSAKPAKFREEYVEQWIVEGDVAATSAADALGADALDDYWDWLHPAPDDDFDEVDNPEVVFDCCDGDGDYDRAADRTAEYESVYGLWRPDYDAEQTAWKLAHGPFEPDPDLIDPDLTPEQLAALTAEVISRRSRLERL